MIQVEKHNILAGVGPNDSDILVCIKEKNDWYTYEYNQSIKDCPICGEKIK